MKPALAATAAASPAEWLAEKGWAPFPFQLEVWEALARGRSPVRQA